MPALPRPPNAVTWQKPRHGQKLAGYKKKGGMRRSEKVGREISKELWRGGRDWGVKSSSSQNASGNPLDVFKQDVRGRSSIRVSRLEGLLVLRKIYRNFIRASYLLEQPAPLYEVLQQRFEEESKRSPPVSEQESAERTKEVKFYVLKLVAEMLLTSEQLMSNVRDLSPGVALLFPEDTREKDMKIIKETCLTYVKDLKRRVSKEIPKLPFSSKYVHRAVAESREKKPVSRFADSTEAPSPIERLGKAEKAAENFVAEKLQQVRKIPPEEYIGNIQDTAIYLGNLWDRLNGGGRGSQRSLLVGNIPRPTSSEEEYKTAMSQLSLELEKTEKLLQNASKARESKLRKADLKERLRLAFQLKIMDDEVLQLTRLLAVQSLQLQMEYIYSYLEDEALDISEDARAFGHITRQGSTEELSLYTAEFSILDAQLSTLVQTLTQKPTVLVQDNLLQALVEEIDDLMKRLGISPEMVLGVSGLGMRKVELQLKDARGKVFEGGEFLVRGVRLFGSDITNSTQLFYRAALGGTLKPREVAALRRTFRDLFTFIPFMAILIIPLTPVGHVLVFGFLQKYFPDLFPSQFTSRRQNIMMRYDVLREELVAAQDEVEEAEEEAELVRAQEAVARLTAPVVQENTVSSFKDGGGLLERLRRLQEQVAAAANDVVEAVEDEG